MSDTETGAAPEQAVEVLVAQPRNPYHDENKRFIKGNPGGGRTKGARDKIQKLFLNALVDDFSKYGVGAIRRMRNKKPADYIKVIASLMPKQIEVDNKPFDEVPDEELYDLVSTAREAIRFAQGGGAGGLSSGGDEQAAELSPVPEADGVPSRGGVSS